MVRIMTGMPKRGMNSTWDSTVAVAEALEAFENWLKDAERNGDNGI